MKYKIKFTCRLLFVLAATAGLTAADAAQPAAQGDASAVQKETGGLSADMKLDDLVKQDVMVPAMSQVVNTVDRTESTVGRSPAAIFVITQEMIRRSGVRSIPEALRMAPGIEVAKVDSNTWAITARGFNSKFADKLLVQIDRRVVYQNTFGGVYWDIQDVVLADVERIEVIRGPQVVAWGSNAMNGVINIITKNSKDTQGALIQSGGGNQERDFNVVRYGGQAAEDLTWRAWGQEFNRNSGWSSTGVRDMWNQQSGGFRMDYTPSKQDTITLQGDMFNGYEGERNFQTIPAIPFFRQADRIMHVQGGNVLFRCAHDTDEDTGWQLQTYYDNYERHRGNIAPAPLVGQHIAENRDTYDLDFQYRFSPWEDHHFISGANYRNSPDTITSTVPSFFMVPQSYASQWASVFAQDTMTLVEDRWYFTLGCRLEYQVFGGFQAEPTARLLFQPSNHSSAWVAISRTARMPTRFDDGIRVISRVPGSFTEVFGNPNFEPEGLLAYEAGYRAAPTDYFSWDIATFINDYDKLYGLGPRGGLIPGPPPFTFVRPIPVLNNNRAFSYGAELSGTWQWTQYWKWSAAYTWLQIDAEGNDPFFVNLYNWGSPHNQVYLRSSMNLASDVQFDVIGRYVDKLRLFTFPPVPNYFEMDARLAWHATKNLEFSFVGQNLINNHHFEYGDAQLGLIPTAVRRGYYGMMTWTY